jgi:hypothetical protein
MMRDMMHNELTTAALVLSSHSEPASHFQRNSVIADLEAPVNHDYPHRVELS